MKYNLSLTVKVSDFFSLSLAKRNWTMISKLQRLLAHIQATMTVCNARSYIALPPFRYKAREKEREEWRPKRRNIRMRSHMYERECSISHVIICTMAIRPLCLLASVVLTRTAALRALDKWTKREERRRGEKTSERRRESEQVEWEKEEETKNDESDKHTHLRVYTQMYAPLNWLPFYKTRMCHVLDSFDRLQFFSIFLRLKRTQTVK